MWLSLPFLLFYYGYTFAAAAAAVGSRSKKCLWPMTNKQAMPCRVANREHPVTSLRDGVPMNAAYVQHMYTHTHRHTHTHTHKGLPKRVGKLKIGAGSLVISHVLPHVTVAGVPASVVGVPAHEQPALAMNQRFDI